MSNDLVYRLSALVVEDRFIIGNPEECLEETHRYKDLGVDKLILRSQWTGMEGEVATKSFHLSAEKVMAKFV